MLKIQLILNVSKLQVSFCICVDSQANNCKKAGISFIESKENHWYSIFIAQLQKYYY